MSKSPYFSRLEWRGFWITVFISFSVYVYTLAPNVTLEDSGEFLTAAYHWGVPHPPGYPAWAISANIFERLIPFGNAAWRGNLMSAFYGALAAGLLSLITSKFAIRLWKLERFKDFSMANFSREAMACMAGIVAGLVYAFIDTMWSQAVITEVYTLNGFFFTLLCLLVLRWFDNPHQWGWACLISFFFGLGITNHQTILVSAPAFLFAMFCIDRLLCREASLLASIGSTILAWQSGLWFMWVIAAVLFVLFLYLLMSDPEAFKVRTALSTIFSLKLASLAMVFFVDRKYWLVWFGVAGIFFAIEVGLVIRDLNLEKKAIKAARPFFFSVILLLAGSSVYLYMPLSSHTNPPMNWGYTRTTDGFRHHILREQYERIQPKRPPLVLMAQYSQFFSDLEDNFSLPLILLGVLPLLLIVELPKKEKEYVAFTVLCFFFMGFVLVFLLNAKFDEQSAFINRVFYSLAHGVYAFWVGLGSIVLLYWARQSKNTKPFLVIAAITALLAVFGWLTSQTWTSQAICLSGSAVFFSCISGLLRQTNGQTVALALVSALPLIPLASNWRDSEMKGHDFGWRYGHDMLMNLEKNAVVYGGTDPGRFVPTYMIFVESFQPKKWKRDPNFDRRDLYIITQNALADQTYMNYIRDHYATYRPKMEKWYEKLLGRDQLYPKDPLEMPDDEAFGEIFSKTVEANKDKPDSGVVYKKDSSGRIQASVQGVQGVFTINGAIAQWIFEHNKHKHAFYVEESYPIAWMYPYLEPAGLIMKLNNEPLKEIAPDTIARDLACWKKLESELLSNPAFVRDSVARKAFSKLRSSIGGLYLYRNLNSLAEEVLKQSLEFYPASAEARSRLTDLYVNSGRLEDALKNCQDWRKVDPFNSMPAEILDRVLQFKELAMKEKEMASLYEFNKRDPSFIFQYVAVLQARNNWAEIDRILDEFINQKDIEPGNREKVLQFYAQFNRLDRVEMILARLVKLEPANASIWFNLAVVQSVMFKGDQACASLEKAIKFNSNALQQARAEPRFNNIHAMQKFQELVK